MTHKSQFLDPDYCLTCGAVLTGFTFDSRCDACTGRIKNCIKLHLEDIIMHQDNTDEDERIEWGKRHGKDKS